MFRMPSRICNHATEIFECIGRLQSVNRLSVCHRVSMNFFRRFLLLRRSNETRQTPAAMDKRFQEIVSKTEPIPDSIYGPRNRCSLTLKDGTEIPCAVLQ